MHKRLGGDEFVLLLDGVHDEAHLEARAHAVAGSLVRPMHIAAVPDTCLGVNIGGAICPRHGASIEALLAAADHAMYTAKHGRRIYALAQPGSG